MRVYDLLQYEHGPDDVLILATDGLWDVLLNEEVAEAVTNFLPNCDPDDPHRFVLIPDFLASSRKSAFLVTCFCGKYILNNIQYICNTCKKTFL